MLIGVQGMRVDEGSAGNTLTRAMLETTDIDNSASQLTYQLVSVADHGLLQLDGETLGTGDTFTQHDVDLGRVTYTHNGSETTSDRFDFTVDDGAGTISSGTLPITITPLNDEQALTVNQGLTLSEGGWSTIDNSQLATRDADHVSGQVTYTLQRVAAHGLLQLDGMTLSTGDTFTQDDIDLGRLTYTHNGGETYSDHFEFTVDDGLGTSAEGSFQITITPVNDGPLATDDVFSTDEDTVLSSFGSLLDNDIDQDGDTLSALLVRGPEHGTLTLQPDGSFEYSPDANFSGSDSFAYQAHDGTQASSTTTVRITVAPVNDAPTAFAEHYRVLNADTLVVEGLGVLLNDVDAEGNQLQAVILTQPDSGAVTMNTDGSFVYQPDPAFFGSVSFTYVATDGEITSDPVDVTIDVTPLGNSNSPTISVTQEDRRDTDETATEAELPNAISVAPPQPAEEAAKVDRGEPPAKRQESVVAIHAAANLLDLNQQIEFLEVGAGQESPWQLRESTGATLKRVEIVGRDHQGDPLKATVPVTILDVRQLWRHLDNMADELEMDAFATRLVAGGSVVLTTGIAAGYVLWMVRGSYLIALLSSSLPAWAMMDPLPVLDDPRWRATRLRETAASESLLDLVR